jgi:UDP-glucuronate decarboxylase
MHMATTSAHETFAGEDPLAKFHMLVQGTERVLQFAGTCEAKKVLFTSSGVAYGAYPDEMQRVPESYQGAPMSTDSASALAQGKRAAEFLCSHYAQKYQFEYTIARCFSFVGPGLPLDIHYAIGNFIRDALHGEGVYDEVITVKGDGSPMRSFLYLGDLVHWLLALLVDGRSETIYNVGSDQAISILDLAYLVRDTLAPSKEIIVLGNSDHNIGNFARNWYVPDINLARTELNLDVWTSLPSALIKTANYLKQ